MLFDTRHGPNGLVCDMVVSVDGDILAYQFYEATIRSRARFTYEDFWEIIKDDDIESLKILVINLN